MLAGKKINSKLLLFVMESAVYMYLFKKAIDMYPQILKTVTESLGADLVLKAF